MNGNPSASYAQLRKGALAGPDFSFFKQQAGHEGDSTSGITAQNSFEKFTRWTNDIGSGRTPNAALVGKGQVNFNSAQQPPTMG